MVAKKKIKSQKYLVTILNTETGKNVFCFDTPVFSLTASSFDAKVVKDLSFIFQDVKDVLLKPEKKKAKP